MVAARGGTIYFWREFEHPYGFLSQWHSSPFTTPPPNSPASQDLVRFVTTEQYMMYRKALLFNDEEIAEKIMRERNPKKQKALGRKVANFDHKTWDQHKEEIVEDGNWYKFTANDDENMKTLLVATEEKLLVEASPYDRIWGIGFNATNAEANKGEWGLNLLGMALMRVRSRIMANSPKAADPQNLDTKQQQLDH